MRRVLILFLIALFIGALVFGVSKKRQVSIVIPHKADEAQTARLMFVGDMMFDREVKTQIQNAQDPLYPFARIAPFLREADLTFGNLEGPISARGKNQGSKYSFRFEPVGTINALKFAGFDVVSVANNHIWDWGKDALVDTMSHLEAGGVGYVGIGSNEQEANAPYLTQVGDTSIAFLGYTTLYPQSLEAGADYPGISSFDTERTNNLIRSLKESGEADIVIVSMHWGEEYQAHSNENQQKVAHALVDAGADMIIGHHPHVIQEVEQYKNGYIVYSLGNFIFDQFFSKETMEGLLLTATLQDKKITEVKETKVKLTETFQPYIVGEQGDPARE